MTLVILAAGMGSRYGGLKQIDPIGENGEFIIDYSIRDAVRAGFSKVVFIIKEENYEIFKSTVGARISPFVRVEYAFQSVDALPDGFTAPSDRTRPFGTAHALICAKGVIDENFAVINSDDFYGRGSFESMASVLPFLKGREACMVGYKVENTLSENGSVSRGVCKVENGYTVSITEHTKIYGDGDSILCSCEGNPHEIEKGTFVSMNFFGFTKDILPLFEMGFKEFLRENEGSLKAEYYLPEAAGKYASSIRLIPTSECWFGVTYKEDRESTAERIRKMTREGIYSSPLFER